MFLPVHRRDTRALASVGRMLLTVLLMAVALSNVILPLIEQRWRQLSLGEPPIDFNVLGWGQDGLIVAGLLLLLLGRALVRGKRQAWLLSVALFTYSFLDTFLEKSYWFSLVLTGCMLLLLFLLAPLFSVRSNTASFLRGYSVLALMGVCIFGYGTALRVLQHGRIAPFLFTRADILFTLRILCFLVLVYGMMAILRPVHLHTSLWHSERLRTERVVQSYGCLALVYFALSADKHYFWSETGLSLIAYRVVQGVALALGDPIGPEEEREHILKAFLAFCQRQDWRVGLYQASPHTHAFCQKYDLYPYKIGEEAVIDIASFTIQGKSGAAVRHAVSRAKRDGVSIHCLYGQTLPDTLFSGMKHLSVTWMQEQKIQRQLGFSMGRFPTDWSPELLTVVALSSTGEVQAFLTWTPMYAGEGWALDVMRRGKETSPGTMEFLIAESVAWAKIHGDKRMSLGLAPLAGLIGTLSHSSTLSFIERSAAYLHHQGLLLGQYRSLYAFKAKFQPQWEERYMIVSERQSLPQILLAMARVHGYGIRPLLRDAWSALHSLKTLVYAYKDLRLAKEKKQEV